MTPNKAQELAQKIADSNPMTRPIIGICVDYTKITFFLSLVGDDVHHEVVNDLEVAALMRYVGITGILITIEERPRECDTCYWFNEEITREQVVQWLMGAVPYYPEVDASDAEVEQS